MYFKALAKRDKKLLRLQNQAKLRSRRTSTKHTFGYQMPRNNDYEHALYIDKHNENNRWTEYIELETQQHHENYTCKNAGTVTPPKDFKKIRDHFAFNVKYDGRHNARLVSNRNITDVLLSSVCSGVVSLRGTCLVLFLAELSRILGH